MTSLKQNAAAAAEAVDIQRRETLMKLRSDDLRPGEVLEKLKS